MKSNAPWSVKGIERDARETAKEAARREGMTVGEWLSQVIRTAGDPLAHGEIEGLKLTDLVTAIEHVSGRVGVAENRAAAAFDELARNVGGLVERVQRLERVRPAAEGATPDLDERLARIEEKLADRSRVEALKSLEKALVHVAAQFETAQRTVARRQDATERQVQELASRLDASAAPDLGALKDTIDALIARLARVERLASEPKTQGATTADPEFVERTGAKLRALADEIKRGGDQVRLVEASIARLSDHIEAAERRSSEGVAKVAETLAELRGRLTQSVSANTTPEPANAEPTTATLIDEYGLASPTAVEDAPGTSLEDEFAFDDEPETQAETPQGEAESLESTPAAAEEDIDGIDAILAELDSLTSGEERAATTLVSAPAAEAGLETEPVSEKRDFLQEARRAAREAAEKAAQEQSARRKLTPKQRAILAAKIRRKRLAEQGQAEPPLAVPAPPSAPQPEEEAPACQAKRAPDEKSLAAKLLGALKKQQADAAVGEEISADAPPPSVDGNPNLARGALTALSGLKKKPVALALAIATALAVMAVFFLVKDLFRGVEPPSAPAPVVDEGAKPQLKETEVPPAPAPLTQPRTLYLNAVQRLRAAGSEADTRTAVSTLEQAAALGHPPAQLQLGELYKLGQGVPQDLAQARAWYERAANGGNVLAMHRMGVMSARGQGGPADQQAAIAWFEKAAALGLVDSQYNLGAIYHPGSSGAAAGDATKAYYWYALAAKGGDSQAGSLAAGLASELSAERKAELDAQVAAFQPATPDPDANEIAPAS